MGRRWRRSRRTAGRMGARRGARLARLRNHQGRRTRTQRRRPSCTRKKKCARPRTMEEEVRICTNDELTWMQSRQSQDLQEEPAEEEAVAPEHVDREAMAEMALYEAERAHGIDDMLMSEEESEEEETDEEGPESQGTTNGRQLDTDAEPNHGGEVNGVQSKEPEKMLSKKERKAKEMEELDRIFEEMGITVENKESKDEPSKKSKKKKKKAERAAAANNTNDSHAPDPPAAATKEAKEHPAAAVEATASNGKAFARPKPSGASGKKKSAGKQVSAAAKAAAEAKARASKMAKKKDPSKFNQLPTR